MSDASVEPGPPLADRGGSGRRAAVGRGALETLGFSALALPLTFGISIVTSRLLHPEGRGAYVLALLSVDIVARLLANDAAVINHLGREGAEPRGVVTQALVQDAALGVAGVAILVPLTILLTSGSEGPVWIAAFALPAVLTARTMGGALLGRGRLRAWNLLQLLPTALTLGTMLVLVGALSMSVAGAVAAWLAAQIVLALVALVLGRELWWPIRLQWLRRDRARSLLSLTLRLGSVNVTTLLHYRIELVLLQALSGLAAVGIYSLATSLAEMLWLIPTALSSAIVAPAVQSSAKGTAELAARGARHAVLATAVAGGFLAVVGSLLIPLVYGSAFSASIDPLLILILAAVSTAPGSPLAVYLSMKLGKARYALSTTIASAVVTTAFALWLIPSYGVVGAAISTTIGYAAGQLIEVAWFARVSGVQVSHLVPTPSDLGVYWQMARSMVQRSAS